jgi:hypothetical protein
MEEAGAGMMGGQSGTFSKWGFGGRRVRLESGVGGVAGGVVAHQLSRLALELLF